MTLIPVAVHLAIGALALLSVALLAWPWLRRLSPREVLGAVAGLAALVCLLLRRPRAPVPSERERAERSIAEAEAERARGNAADDAQAERVAEEAQAEAERMKTAGPTPEALERVRREIEEHRRRRLHADR